MLLATLLSERTMTKEENRKGCLMAMVNEKYAKLIQAWSMKHIPDNILYIEGSDYGREKETHATILYGFTRDLTSAEVQNIVKDTKPFLIKVVGTNVFNNPQYDVITLKVQSPELDRLNGLCKKYPFQSNYPKYNPHITLAYVQPGYGKKYENITAKTITGVLCDSVMYSGINNEKTSHNLFEDAYVNPPPATQQQAFDQTFSADFVNFVRKLENEGKVGFSNGKWHIHPAPEGGFPEIAYGHKIKTHREEQKFSQGLDDREATKLLVKDLLEAKDKVRKYIDQKYKVHLMLDKKQMEMLTEFAFNLGGLEKFPNFTDAVLRKDWARAAKEYKRGYHTASGEHKDLARRNQMFFDRYLK